MPQSSRYRTLIDNTADLPIVSLVGPCGSGKTAVLCRLYELCEQHNGKLASTNCAVSNFIFLTGHGLQGKVGERSAVRFVRWFITEVNRIVFGDTSHDCETLQTDGENEEMVWSNLLRVLNQALRSAAEKKMRFRLFLDAPELFSEPWARSLAWLPKSGDVSGDNCDIPVLTLVVAAVERSAAHVELQKRKSVEFRVNLLERWERGVLVRHMLAQYAKCLDENAFNNQMVPLIAKRAAGSAVYLRLACEELRLFGVFEEVCAPFISCTLCWYIG